VVNQREFDLSCEWGVEGLLVLKPAADAIVIVDVLSFSTGVDIALSNGAAVLPYRWKDDSAKQFAAEKGAGRRAQGRRHVHAFAGVSALDPRRHCHRLAITQRKHACAQHGRRSCFHRLPAQRARPWLAARASL